jgi:hypothetical protein
MDESIQLERRHGRAEKCRPGKETRRENEVQQRNRKKSLGDRPGPGADRKAGEEREQESELPSIAARAGAKDQ